MTQLLVAHMKLKMIHQLIQKFDPCVNNCTLLYTQLYAHIQNCWMISTTQLLYHVTV